MATNVTLEELKAQTGVADNQLALVCSDEHLNKVAEYISNYLKYADAFNLKPHQTAGINTNVSLEFLMKTQRVLQVWKKSNLYSATYECLVEVALQVGDSEVAEVTCNLCRDCKVKDTPSSFPTFEGWLKHKDCKVKDTPSSFPTFEDISLYNLTDELGELTDPISFGIHLKIPQKDMTRIETTYLHPTDIDGQKKELFKYIASNHKAFRITWTTIADALSKTRHGDLSLKIREKYC